MTPAWQVAGVSRTATNVYAHELIEQNGLFAMFCGIDRCHGPPRVKKE